MYTFVDVTVKGYSRDTRRDERSRGSEGQERWHNATNRGLLAGGDLHGEPVDEQIAGEARMGEKYNKLTQKKKERKRKKEKERKKKARLQAKMRRSAIS